LNAITLRTILLTGAIAGLLAFLHFAPVGREEAFWLALQNYAHVPLFAVLTAMLFALVPGSLRSRPTLPYAFAFCAAMLLGFLSEVAQIAGPREAELADIIRDACGSAGALAFLFAFGRVPQRARAYRLPAVLAGTILLLAPAAPVVDAAVTRLHRNRAFPVICSFESVWDLRGLAVTDTRVVRVAPPSGWEAASGAHAGQVTFLPGDTWARFGWSEPYPDWREFRRFAFEVWSGSDSTQRVHLRIHDEAHDQSYEDRYNTRLAIAPGATTVRIPLSDLTHAPDGRAMDMGRIHNITLFADRDAPRFTLYFDDFRLER
jgi:VanZ family protein